MNRAQWVELAAAAAAVPDGALVAPGGFMLGRAPMDLIFELVRQRRHGLSVISLPNPPIEDLAKDATGLKLARIGNDAMAELCRKHPERFAGFVAAVALTDVDGSLAETRRAVNELGACGIQIFTAWRAARSTIRPLRRSSPRWRRSTGQSGCIPPAARR